MTENTGKITAEKESKDTSKDKNIKNTKDNISEKTGTGKLRFTMRNDYMFKAVLQENEKALKELLAVLLHKKVMDIKSIHHMNPIILGETINDKMVILDIRVILNDEECINIEMQVTRQEFWPERTLVYVCRNFSDLNKGEEYDKVKAVIHIGIMDFRLDKKDKRFYSENVLTDKETGEVYSEKLFVNELSLKNIENATPEQRRSGLYDWAKFFAARTWEELKMAATKSEAMKSAVVTMEKLTADDKVRLQCEARERYECDIRTWQSLIRKAEECRQQAEEDKQKAETDKQKAEGKLNGMLELLRKNPSATAADLLKNME